MGRKVKHNYKELYQRHLDGESIKRISESTGVHVQCMYSYFRKNKWKYNKDIVPRQKGYTVNDSYLDEMNSEDKAYFLGWMLSDGYIQKNKIYLKLKKPDSYIIEEMFSKFSKGYKLLKEKEARGKSVSSTKITNKLRKYGCVENKTVKGFKLPILPKELYRHFIRGYFDGDGSISIRTERKKQVIVSICSIDLLFLEQLKNKLKEFNINSSIYKEKRKGRKMKLPGNICSIGNYDMYRIVIGSHKDRLKFYEFLYKNCSIKLERKFKLYNDYYANTVLTLESKNSKAVQRIGDETLINYDLVTDRLFYQGNEINEVSVIDLFNSGKCEYHIHKLTGIDRGRIHKLIKEYNSPTSVRHPENG